MILYQILFLYKIRFITPHSQNDKSPPLPRFPIDASSAHESYTKNSGRLLLRHWLRYTL